MPSWRFRFAAARTYVSLRPGIRIASALAMKMYTKHPAAWSRSGLPQSIRNPIAVAQHASRKAKRGRDFSRPRLIATLYAVARER
jgi:hypothetical protein